MLPEEGISVSEFIAVFNQTLDYAYPKVAVVGELANFRVSKNKWLYFDLKDEFSSLKFFGTVYNLNQPLEEGMMLKVTSAPRMHNTYGFSMQVQSIELVGEGSIKRAAELVQAKLAVEGLFDPSRKRQIIYPPSKIGLITSAQSAAYADFIKILNSRWRGIEINLIDVQVQGEPAIEQIIYAIKQLNEHKEELDAIVIIRGGGSPEDLAAFNSEHLTRAVAGSKIPTLVAIGHEIDVCLAELAADKRASTPSNAAELLVPDRKSILSSLSVTASILNRLVLDKITVQNSALKDKNSILRHQISQILETKALNLKSKRHLVEAYNPALILRRGYSIVRKNRKIIVSKADIAIGDILDIRIAVGDFKAKVSDLGE